MCFFFFFQAEDGIRHLTVTGVQTCALPIFNRIPDAQQAYLDLYAGNRPLAGKLLTAMKSWVADQRATAAGGNAPNLDELDKWIQERAQIAGQTAALTRAGT